MKIGQKLHRMRQLQLVLFALIFVLHGCSSSRLKQEQLEKIRTVSTFVFLPKEIPIIATGFFENKIRNANVSAWNLAEVLGKRLSERIEQHGLKSLILNPDLSQIQKDLERSKKTWLRKAYVHPYKRLEEYALQISKEKGADHLILVYPFNVDETPMIPGSGYGLVCETMLTGSRWKPYYSLQLVVKDVATQKTLAISVIPYGETKHWKEKSPSCRKDLEKTDSEIVEVYRDEFHQRGKEIMDSFVEKIGL